MEHCRQPKSPISKCLVVDLVLCPERQAFKGRKGIEEGAAGLGLE